VWEQLEYIKDEPVSSLFRRLEPHFSETIYMTMRKQKHPPLQADKGMFDVVMVVTKSEKDLKRLDQHWNHAKSLLQSTCFPRVPIPREKAENRRETSSLGCFVENIS
jgi:hypothetical protein